MSTTVANKEQAKTRTTNVKISRTSSSVRTTIVRRMIARTTGRTNASQTGTLVSRTAKTIGNKSARTRGKMNVRMRGDRMIVAKTTEERMTVVRTTDERMTVAKMTGEKMTVVRTTEEKMTVAKMTGEKMTVDKMTGEKMTVAKMTGEKMTVARTRASLTQKRLSTPCLPLKSKLVVASRSLLRIPRLIRRAQANPRVVTRSLLMTNRRTTKISAPMTLLTKQKNVRTNLHGNWRLAGCPRAMTLELDSITTATAVNTLMADGLSPAEITTLETVAARAHLTVLRA